MSDKLPDGELSATECALCDRALAGLEAEAEYVSVGIDRNAPAGMPLLLWLTAEDGMAIGAIRMSAARARKVAADLLALATDG